MACIGTCAFRQCHALKRPAPVGQRIVIVPGLYDRYRKYQRHDLLGSLLLVNGKPVRSQWVNESTGAREPGERDPHALCRSDRPGIDLAWCAYAHTAYTTHTRCPRIAGNAPLHRDFQWPIPANGLKWIEMDSDFQKYWFTNVKMNTFQFWIHFYSFIKIAWSIFLFKNNISFFYALWILFNSKFWIANAVFQFNWIQLNLIETN